MTQTIPARPRFDESEEMRENLRRKFPKEQIGRLPKTDKRPALDFVGHAAVTDRLNQAAPGWTYTVDELFSVEGTVWIRGTMTIGGISRPEYGDGDDAKEAIGNFIRRGAMRFGVALDLWSREELQPSARTAGKASPGRKPTAEGITEAFGEGVTDPSAVGATSSAAEGSPISTAARTGTADDGADPGVTLTPPGEVAAPGSACLHVHGTKLDRTASRDAGHRIDVCVDCGAVLETTS